MTPSDEARIMALIGMIAVNAQRGNATFARAHANELVAVATAAAYRHAAVFSRAAMSVHPPDIETAADALQWAAKYFDAWAEKAEAEKGQP